MMVENIFMNTLMEVGNAVNCRWIEAGMLSFLIERNFRICPRLRLTTIDEQGPSDRDDRWGPNS